MAAEDARKATVEDAADGEKTRTRDIELKREERRLRRRIRAFGRAKAFLATMRIAASQG